jgi:NAD(P)-dependent dehydrogenase (short-subunit alcohol dehydrogenase family)
MDNQRKGTIMSDFSCRTTVLVGASRGLGRGIATAFVAVGGPVNAVYRTAAGFLEPANGAGTNRSEVADAGDATVAENFFARASLLVTPEIAGIAWSSWYGQMPLSPPVTC